MMEGGVDADMLDLIHDLEEASRHIARAPERSEALPAGIGLNGAANALPAIGFVILGADDDTFLHHLSYIYRLQRATQAFAVVIMTNSSTLKTVRRFGWLTEHFPPPDAFSLLQPQDSYVEMVTSRLRTSTYSLGLQDLVVMPLTGVTYQAHEHLCQALKVEIPFSAMI